VFTPLELVRQATSIPAELMMLEGQIGCIAPGAFADLLVVDGNPVEDIALMADPGRNVHLIMKGGVAYKDRLNR